MKWRSIWPVDLIILLQRLAVAVAVAVAAGFQQCAVHIVRIAHMIA